SGPRAASSGRADAAARTAPVSSSTRVATTSATGRVPEATCRRTAAPRPAAGRSMTGAPAAGPEPTAVRTMPMASRMRIASRTEGRETPSSSASARSGGRRSPRDQVPAASPCSMRSRTRSWVLTAPSYGCGLSTVGYCEVRPLSPRMPRRRDLMRIALAATCIADAMFPQAPRAVVTLLERLGHEVVFPPGQACCGQMHVNTGYLADAVPVVRNHVRTFAPVADGEWDAVVVPSGSCTGSIRHQQRMVLERAGLDAEARTADAVAG